MVNKQSPQSRKRSLSEQSSAKPENEKRMGICTQAGINALFGVPPVPTEPSASLQDCVTPQCSVAGEPSSSVDLSKHDPAPHDRKSTGSAEPHPSPLHLDARGPEGLRDPGDLTTQTQPIDVFECTREHHVRADSATDSVVGGCESRESAEHIGLSEVPCEQAGVHPTDSATDLNITTKEDESRADAAAPQKANVHDDDKAACPDSAGTTLESGTHNKNDEGLTTHVVRDHMEHLRKLMQWPRKVLNNMWSGQHENKPRTDGSDATAACADSDKVRWLQHMVGCTSGLKLSTAFSGIDTPSTALSCLALAMVDEMGEPVDTAPRFQNMYAIEVFSKSQVELQRTPHGPRCIFGDISEFWHPEMVGKVQTMLQSGNFVDVIQRLIQSLPASSLVQSSAFCINCQRRCTVA